MKFIIEKASAQRILDYLAKRPFDEVFELIPLLMRLETLPEPEATSEGVSDGRPDRKRPA